MTLCHLNVLPIGLYRDVWIAAIASSTTSVATRTAAICVRFQGRRVRRVYVTMQITFLTRKSALIYRRDLRQRVASLTLNCNGVLAIRAYDVMICMYFLHSFRCTNGSGYCIIFFPSGHHYLITFEKSLIKTGHLSNANILGKWLCCFAFASTRDD